MIPESVKSYLAKDTGDVYRSEKKSVIQTLCQLGVETSTEFGEFYLEYQGGFISPRPVAELMDIQGPAIPSIPDQTEYVRDRYELPEKFLALTSDESEGMYLYNREDQKVYDFDLEKRKDFIAGKELPRWNSFNEFLSWYFDDSDGL